MQAISIMALDEGHEGQQHADHGNAAKDTLIAHNLERLYVHICHEVVLKGDLGGLHTLQDRHIISTCRSGMKSKGSSRCTYTS